MIGYYVHHVGRGHLRHAQCVAAEFGNRVTGLSSLPRPADWHGDWIELPPDDTAAHPVDTTAHGQLHWVPRRDMALRSRMGVVARWIESSCPSAMVVDVSVEVALFARLMGVPVIVMALPGDRHDRAHQLAYSVADKIIAPWPAGLDALDRSLGSWLDRTVHVGGISRFAGRSHLRTERDPGTTVLVLEGAGGGGSSTTDIRAAAAATPGSSWRRLGVGEWLDDPWPVLCQADVVVTHAGAGGIADVAAARRPAVVVPQARPYDEQLAMAAALRAADLAVTVPCWPSPEEWPAHLAAACRLGGDKWVRWSAPGGARRVAAVIGSVAAETSRSEC